MPIFNKWVLRKLRLMRNFAPRWRNSLRWAQSTKWMPDALLPQVQQVWAQRVWWAPYSVVTNLT